MDMRDQGPVCLHHGVAIPLHHLKQIHKAYGNKHDLRVSETWSVSVAINRFADLSYVITAQEYEVAPLGVGGSSVG